MRVLITLANFKAEGINMLYVKSTLSSYSLKYDIDNKTKIRSVFYSFEYSIFIEGVTHRLVLVTNEGGLTNSPKQYANNIFLSELTSDFLLNIYVDQYTTDSEEISIDEIQQIIDIINKAAKVSEATVFNWEKDSDRFTGI